MSGKRLVVLIFKRKTDQITESYHEVVGDDSGWPNSSNDPC